VGVVHPNVVDVFTAGVTGDGRFYYVMELLRGSSLRRILDAKGPLELRFCLPIALAVAQALETAHGKGVVHRDVSPGNIFVSRQANRTSVVKVLDFGAVALMDNLRSLQKGVGMMLGTPQYAAPEQQRGEQASPAMDVWSLGAVLFEMVTGVAPLERGVARRSEKVAGLSDAGSAPLLTQVVPSAPARLSRLVASMLEKDVARRTPSMSTAVSELRAIEASQ
jgi:serine/threonine-protein kinase